VAAPSKLERSPDALGRGPIEDLPSRRRVFHGVTASARERGLGGYVLSEALREFWSEHPGVPLRLSAPVENVAASRLYRRQGFAPWLVVQPFELGL